MSHENGKDELRARFRAVSPGYFATLGISLLEGRDFTEADRLGSELVVIVSKNIAQQIFPGQVALNRHLQWTDPLIKYGASARSLAASLVSWPTLTTRASYPRRT